MPDPDNLGYLLNYAARLAKKDLTNRMEENGLTFSQWIVLKDIYSSHQSHREEKLTLADIAARLHAARPTITGIIDRLEKQGMINKKINPNDRRAQVVTLTQHTRGIMEQLHQLSVDTAEKALRGFDDNEVIMLKNLLVRVIDNLQSPIDESKELIDSGQNKNPR